MANVKGVHQTHILTHATLVGLTPLIPLPFIDEMVREILLRRMVRTLASAHGLDLSPADVRTLADEPKESWLKGAAVSVVLMPLRMLLRKTFILLQGKRIIDLASNSYHRGYLIDVAFADRWCVPAGPRRPEEVRFAIDAVCKEANTEPVRYALRVGFEQSRAALVIGVEQLRRRFASLRRTDGAPPEPEVSATVEQAAAEQSEAAGIGGVVERLRKAIAEVPAEHFEDLRQRLTDRLSGIRT
jgi:hypothetical protein